MIFVLLPQLYHEEMSNVGGGEISNLLLISSISKFDRVIVVPMLYSNHGNHLFNENRVSVVNTKFSLVGRLGYTIQKYLLFNRRVMRLAKKHKPSKIISTRSTIIAAHNIKKATSCQVEIIVRAYEDFHLDNKYDTYKNISLFRKIESTLCARQINDAYLASDRIITNSKFMKKAVIDDLGMQKQCIVIYPEIDMRRQKSRFTGLINVGFINRGLKKGSQVIIKLARMNPGIKFLVFGEILESIHSNIINMGYLNDRNKIYNSIDALLVPSLWHEPYGRVASEAIWSGIPVLVSKRGGLLEAAPNPEFWVSEFDNITSWNLLLNSLKNNKRRINETIDQAQEVLAAYNHDYY